MLTLATGELKHRVLNWYGINSLLDLLKLKSQMASGLGKVDRLSIGFKVPLLEFNGLHAKERHDGN